MSGKNNELTLAGYQKLISELVLRRGYDKESINEVFLLLVEEIGELAKAIRKSSGMKVGAHSKSHNVEEEVADVFWLVIDLSNRLGVDLAQAFIDKEEINKKRKWSND